MKKYLLVGFVLWILAAGLWGGLMQTQKKQDIRRMAATPGGVGQVSFSPQTTSAYPNDTFVTEVEFQTGGVPISSITLQISYPYIGSEPELEIMDEDFQNPANQIYIHENLPELSDGHWSFPVRNVTRSGGQVTIELGGFYTNSIDPALGFSTNSPTPLAKIYFRANRVPANNPIVLNFDRAESRMMTKAEPLQDILGYPTNGEYTIQTDNQAPEAINDLRVTGADNQSVDLAWTAPLDVGPEGRADSYDLRYSPSLITNSNWSSANQVSGEPSPANPGATQNFTVSSLENNTTYYFAIRSTDSAGNQSLLSNVPSETTNPATFSFGFKMQGISAGGINKNIDVTFRNSTIGEQVYSGVDFISDSSGIFTPITPFPLINLSIPTNGITVEVLVKDFGHLRKLLGNFTLMPTDNSGPTGWHEEIVKAGDWVSFSGSQVVEIPDNYLDIFDISRLASFYTQLQSPIDSQSAGYDVDADGFINIIDLSLVLANYIQLQTPGD